MPVLKDEKILPYPIDRVFDVALDIERYPEVLSYVQSGRIINRTENALDAVLTVGVRRISLSYACRVEFEKNRHIRVITDEDIFNHLNAGCFFTEIEPSVTKIEYELDCELSRPSLEVLARLLLPHNARHTLSAFEKHLARQRR